MGPFLRGTESHGNVTGTRPRKACTREPEYLQASSFSGVAHPRYVRAKSDMWAKLQKDNPFTDSSPSQMQQR